MKRAAFLSVVLLVYLTWGGVYIYRTSFSHGDSRVFCLWDDAMISMQYAKNLSAGNGLVGSASRASRTSA